MIATATNEAPWSIGIEETLRSYDASTTGLAAQEADRRWATAAAVASSLVVLDEVRKLVGRGWSRPPRRTSPLLLRHSPIAAS